MPDSEEVKSINNTDFKISHHVFIIIGGVLLPLIALIIEIFTNMCSSIFFNPIPTSGHILLIALVPASTLVICWALRTNHLKCRPVLTWLNGAMIGITALYTLRFLPLTVFAFFGIIFYGLGLLALAPHIALITSILCRLILKHAYIKQTRADGRRKDMICFLSGIVLTVILIVALDLPVTFTRIGIQMTQSDSETTMLQGIHWLRNFGDRDFLLRSCYVRPGISDLFGAFFTPVSPDRAREIFYRVTGIPFNSFPRPKFTERNSFFDDADFDWDQGGDTVSQKVKGLSLTDSRLDGSLDPAASLGYLEWTMVFQNSDPYIDREARAQVILPPGAVVSRVTLWVNGEEREAAFAGQGKAREAYQKVVQRQRDPVLVTSAGPDRIMVQCFPIPRNHGAMKIRLGITTPMHLDGLETAQLRLPYFAEHNFEIPPKLQHSVWIEAKTILLTDLKELSPGHPAADVYNVKGLLLNRQIINNAVIRAPRSGTATFTWTEDPSAPDLPVIIQRITEEQLNLPQQIILVIDGSQSIAKYKTAIVSLIPKLPSNSELKLLIAADRLVEIPESNSAEPAKRYKLIGKRILAQHFEGGQDNVPALVKAMNIAAGKESIIIWIHGPQPVILSSPENLDQCWERYSNPPLLYDLQTDNGPNIIWEHLAPMGRVVSVPRLNSFTRDLGFLFDQWSSKQPVIIREGPFFNRYPVSLKTSSHLARLWAHDEVLRLLNQSAGHGKDNFKIHNAVVGLAVRHQIVTPVTGAVVLENRSQYKEADLEPVKPGTVPTIPEPGVWGLLAVGLGLIGLTLLIRRRTRCNQSMAG